MYGPHCIYRLLIFGKNDPQMPQTLKLTFWRSLHEAQKLVRDSFGAPQGGAGGCQVHGSDFPIFF